MQSAGLNLNMVPRESLKLNLGYDWNQTDFSTYYFTSNRIRFHYLNVPDSAILTSLDFLILDNPSYQVDTQTLFRGRRMAAQQVHPLGSVFLQLVEGA